MRYIAITVSSLALAGCFYACTRTEQISTSPPAKTSFAISATTEAVLVEVAEVKGFFKQEGLEITRRLHPYGMRALQDVLAGKADFATAAETPVMFAILSGERISIIATIESSTRGNAVTARKDHGILALHDLRGKRLAVTPGTISEFFLDSLLSVNGISRNEINIVSLPSETMPDALASGNIDAASTFNPYTSQAQKKLGGRGITFENENIYTWTFNVIAKQDYVAKNPGIVNKVLRALVKAEEFVSNNAAEAQQIAADFTGMDISVIRSAWSDIRFGITLDQSLILSLEDESRWAIHNKLTKARTVPNYLNYIYLDGLLAVKPQAVRILR